MQMTPPISYYVVVASTSRLTTGQIVQATAQPTSAAFMLCDGSAVSRDKYKELYAAIGTNWGIGDGSTTFNLPNLQGKFVRPLCALCHGDHNLLVIDLPDHPFFKNNLEYLEWEYERKLSVQKV